MSRIYLAPTDRHRDADNRYHGDALHVNTPFATHLRSPILDGRREKKKKNISTFEQNETK